MARWIALGAPILLVGIGIHFGTPGRWFYAVIYLAAAGGAFPEAA